MKPRLLRSGLTDRIYIVTRYKDLGQDRLRAITKYEITDEELAAIGLEKLDLIAEEEASNA